MYFGRLSKPSARIERWVLRLQGYDYRVICRPGKAKKADALSRLNQCEPKDTSGEEFDFVKAVAEESLPVALTAKQVELASNSDLEIASLRHYILSGDWSQCRMTAYVCGKDELCVLDKLVLRGTRNVVLKALRGEVLRLAHEGHQGIVKMKARLRTKVWWPKIDSDAERVCKSCHGCQVVGEFQVPEPMKRVKAAYWTLARHRHRLDGSSSTGESLLVVVDYYSRFYEVAIMRPTAAKKMVVVLTQIFSRYGFPFTLKSDNGPQFCCEEFEKFLSDHGIEHLTSPPLWPQANGHVERQNRTLLKSLKVALTEGKNWREELQKFLLAYRTTPQTSTGVTPAFLMFGRKLKTKLPELRCAGNLLDEGVRDRDWNHKLIHKKHADNKRGAAESPIAPWDQVLLKNTKTSGKLEANFESEPYTVQTKEGSEVTVRSKEDVEYRRNSALVKRYNPPGELPETIEVVSQETPNTLPLEESIATSRLRRTVRMLEKYKDYVLYELC